MEGGHDLAARHVDRRGAEPVDDFRPEAGNPHLEALKVREAVDLLLEPASHLGPGVSGREGLEAEFAVELVPELLAAAVVHPGIVLPWDQAAGHSAEERDGWMLVGPVARRRMEHVRLPFPDRIEALERRHELTGGVQLDGQPPFGRRRNLVGNALCAGSQPREVLRPRRDELQFTQLPTDAGGLARMLGRTGAPGLLLILVVVIAASGQCDRGANAGGAGEKCSSVLSKNPMSSLADAASRVLLLPSGRENCTRAGCGHLNRIHSAEASRSRSTTAVADHLPELHDVIVYEWSAPKSRLSSEPEP